MNIKSWLEQSTNSLNVAGIQSARLDCLILLEDVLSKDRAQLLAHQEVDLSLREMDKLNNLLSKRLEYTPISYIRGFTEFYGRKFTVSPAVLDPRPESEAIIDQLKLIHKRRPKDTNGLKVLDVGTGSGALAITAKLELPECSVEAVDIDPEAIKIAKTNVDIFTLNISVVKSDLLEDLNKSYDILLCNLPYVPDDFPINKAALHEPRHAIFGGKDGLNLYRKLFSQLNKRSNKPLYILTEALPFQHQYLIGLTIKSGYKLLRTDNLVQVFKLAKTGQTKAGM